MGTEENFDSLESLDKMLEEAGNGEEETKASEEQIEVKPEEVVEATPEVKEGEDAPIGVEEVEPFTPDFTYNVKEEQFEIPEMFRELMTTPERAEEIKSLFCKADGLQHVQAERKELREELRDIKPKYQQYDELYNHVNKLHESQDWEQLVGLLEIPQEAIMKMALKALEYDDLSPEQKMVYDNERRFKEQAYQLEIQNQRYAQQLNQIHETTFQNQVQEAISKPEYSSFIQTFEQQNGEGSFIRELQTRGLAHYQATGVDKSPSELVGELHKMYGGFMQGSATEVQTQAPTTPKAPEQKPVIPATGGGSVSPVSKPINSLEALEREYEASL